MIHRLHGLGLSVRAFEAGANVGGTWYWNCYPGARVDVKSLSYSYSFSSELMQDWSWSSTYAPQPELMQYIEHVAKRFDLRRDIQFETRVTRARFDEETNRWLVGTDRGDRVSTKFLITASGNLSATSVPDLPGLESFEGSWYHTSRWPQESVDLHGKRVGVIGTGSTGIQVISTIAPEVEQLYVFQRTANFSIPIRPVPMDRDFEREYKATYQDRVQYERYSSNGLSYPVPTKTAAEWGPDELAAALEDAWNSFDTRNILFLFTDVLTNQDANNIVADFVREKIRQRVRDPEIAEKLMPRGYAIGTKRLCLDTNYYEAFNRPNVTLVDVQVDPIEAITPKGVRAGEGEYEVDVLIFATGFDAMTGPLRSLNIVGRDGLALTDKWADGPRTYLGVSTADFPNLFFITGPGSPSILSNVARAIEQHVELLGDMLEFAAAKDLVTMEAEQAAEDTWVEHVNEVAHRTLYPRTRSWYMGANIPGKPRVFLPYIGGFGNYRRKCEEVAANGYEGFRLTDASHSTALTAKQSEPAAATEDISPAVI
jgi:cyclohexanone monooxygenase